MFQQMAQVVVDEINGCWQANKEIRDMNTFTFMG